MECANLHTDTRMFIVGIQTKLHLLSIQHLLPHWISFVAPCKLLIFMFTHIHSTTHSPCEFESHCRHNRCIHYRLGVHFNIHTVYIELEDSDSLQGQ